MPETGKPNYQNLNIRLRRLLADEIIAERLNVDQMFILIEGVLPIEACLYYQVLPLFLDGSRLHLGMVCPTDTAASDYVRRIVSYLNYSLVTRQISSEALQIALSAYLKYADQKSSDLAASQPAPAPPDFSRDRPPRNSARDRTNRTFDPALQTTLIVDSPEDLNSLERPQTADSSVSNRRDAPSGQPAAADSAGPPTAPSPGDAVRAAGDRHPESADAIDDSLDDSSALEVDPEFLEQTQVLESFAPPPEMETVTPSPLTTDPSPAAPSSPASRQDAPSAPPPPPPPAKPDEAGFVAPAAASEPPTPPTALPRSPSLLIPPLALTLNPQHLEKSIKELGGLPANDLLQELLARTLASGIGRLYFERQQRFGRILWSESGVLRSVIDRVPVRKFQSIISELKRLAQLPLIEVQTAKQAEIERIYSQSRILLRFRFIPSDHGEQATLQVLRGAALKFYQQQQISRLGRDALGIARQLQIKVNEIRDRARLNPNLSTTRLAELRDLISMLQYIEQQIEDLQSTGQTE
ncbi:MAG: hypothetical protein ACFB8W_10410 [Elainellaceae cyanobacterium]